jgi:hypothetical protein
MSNNPSPEHMTAPPSSPPPTGAPAPNEADGNKLWDDVKAMSHKHKSTLLKALPKVGWALVAALASYVCYLHTTISDIKLLC